MAADGVRPLVIGDWGCCVIGPRASCLLSPRRDVSPAIRSSVSRLSSCCSLLPWCQRCSWSSGPGAGPAGGGELQVAVEALRDRPADEVASLRAMADVFTGEPGIEVGLLACDECESTAAQPVEQADSRGTRHRTTSSWP